jgi:hypothetical protein
VALPVYVSDRSRADRSKGCFWVLNIERLSKKRGQRLLNLLDQIEVGAANGSLGCKEASITKQTYYRWRRE